MKEFNLEEYLTIGVERIVKEIIKVTAKSPRVGIFMAQFLRFTKKATKKRYQYKEKGKHIPPFLIASITTRCNLYCKGCYARANKSCVDDGAELPPQLSFEQWSNIFRQAVNLGIPFVLLAGGEPFLRREVLEEAAKFKKILFPIFTNGTMIDVTYKKLLLKNRNLLPVLSFEGNEQITDERRGKGIYEKLINTMYNLSQCGILFGASITVTSRNMDEVLDDAFVNNISKAGCKAVIYVEYVPVDNKTVALAIDDERREQMLAKINKLRTIRSDILFIAFPGDEKTSGGCLAAGRGFFHINPYGGAEPCPFSPYSDTNLKDVTLEKALESPLFVSLKASGMLTENHIGGCVLFAQQKMVKEKIV